MLADVDVAEDLLQLVVAGLRTDHRLGVQRVALDHLLGALGGVGEELAIAVLDVVGEGDALERADLQLSATELALISLGSGVGVAILASLAGFSSAAVLIVFALAASWFGFDAAARDVLAEAGLIAR